MLRILKFIAAFITVLLLVFLIVFGFNSDALVTLLQNSEDLQEGQEWVEQTYSLKGLTEYIGANPERVSVVSIATDRPDSSILYRPMAPHTMGTVGNVILLAEFVSRSEAGELDPERLVPLEEVSRYQLPYRNESNHQVTVDLLREEGAITDQGEVSLGDLMQSALARNDLAATDYLWFLLGEEELDRMMGELELDATELPLPFSGLYITLTPGIHGRSFARHLDHLSGMSRDAFTREVISAAHEFAQDGVFRENVLAFFKQEKGMGIGFMEERDLLALFPKTTANEMAGLMQNVLEEELLSGEISRTIKTYMEWPLNDERLTKDFTEYGAIYDSRLGMVNGIDFGRSAYDGEAYAQAVFFDPLRVAFWFHMSSNLMHQDFQQRLIWDPALRTATRQEINNPTLESIDNE